MTKGFAIAIAATLVLSAGAARATDIKFSTDGGPSGRHAYFFLAEEKGYFKAEGLNVSIVGGRGSASVVKEVAAGSLDIGFADAGTLALARSREGIAVKLVAVVYRHAPHAMIALKRPDMTKPADLMGKKLADTAGSANVVMFPAYAKAAGFDDKKVEWVFGDFNALPALLVTNQVDAIGQFTLGLPLLVKRAAPKELKVFAYRDSGLDFYSNGVVVRDDYLEKNRATVVKFVRATLKALKDGYADPNAAAAAMAKHIPMIEQDIVAGEMKEVHAVGEDDVTKAKGLGTIDPAAMQKTIDVMAANYEFPKKLTAAEMIDTAVVPEAMGK